MSCLYCCSYFEEIVGDGVTRGWAIVALICFYTFASCLTINPTFQSNIATTSPTLTSIFFNLSFSSTLNPSPFSIKASLSASFLLPLKALKSMATFYKNFKLCLMSYNC